MASPGAAPDAARALEEGLETFSPIATEVPERMSLRDTRSLLPRSAAPALLDLLGHVDAGVDESAPLAQSPATRAAIVSRILELPHPADPDQKKRDPDPVSFFSTKHVTWCPRVRTVGRDKQKKLAYNYTLPIYPPPLTSPVIYSFSPQGKRSSALLLPFM